MMASLYCNERRLPAKSGARTADIRHRRPVFAAMGLDFPNLRLILAFFCSAAIIA